jgi:hypothetical protein
MGLVSDRYLGPVSIICVEPVIIRHEGPVSEGV